MARPPLVTQSNIPRRAANCSVTAWGTIPRVTAAVSFDTADDAPAPLRRSRAERQAIVLDTAERLFAARSSRSVGMDELVRETGLGKMTVYRLFKSKDDLVLADAARAAAGEQPLRGVEDDRLPLGAAAADRCRAVVGGGEFQGGGHVSEDAPAP